MRAFGHRRARESAREVCAYVQHFGWPFLEREQCVEGRDAVCLGGRDLESSRRVAERSRAHPADAALRGAQRGEEEMTARAVAAGDPVSVRGLFADHRV